MLSLFSCLAQFFDAILPQLLAQGFCPGRPLGVFGTVDQIFLVFKGDPGGEIGFVVRNNRLHIVKRLEKLCFGGGEFVHFVKQLLQLGAKWSGELGKQISPADVELGIFEGDEDVTELDDLNV